MKKLLEEIAGEVEELYCNAVDPLRETFAWETRPSKGEIAGPPTVLVLGNHSSGKSTFINYLLGESIQKTGLAPTDDSFTILTHGQQEEFEGKAIVSNPDLPYAGLEHFGGEFLSHLQMKRRPCEVLREVTLVDSPGMIDSAKSESGRGYEFLAAVRWFAVRSDIVLFFFDPDKPGTTGESLQAFTESLHGIHHKLRIVMNKTDQFRSLQDFARAYGALCWNLGKVIPRKDLPLIYTTFVPVDGEPENALSLEEFEQSRAELEAEIRRAPARRVDNMLTQLQDHAARLRMHARVVDRAGRRLRRFRRRCFAVVAAVALLLALAGAASITMDVTWYLPAALFAAAVVAAVAGWGVVRWLVKKEEQESIDGLTLIFETIHARNMLVRERAEDLQALWNAVQGRTRETLEKLGILSFPRLAKADVKRLDSLIETDAPALRSRLHAAIGKSDEAEPAVEASAPPAAVNPAGAGEAKAGSADSGQASEVPTKDADESKESR